MSSSRTTAVNLKGRAGKLACMAGVCAGIAAFVGASASPALASRGYWWYHQNAAPAKVSQELAVCPGQTFSQPFEALNDGNYYTLVEGSEFNGPEEGWELKNGAQVTEATRPDGSTGGVLDLPAGSYAISPPVCVTLQYPTARAYVENVEGFGGVNVSVVYANARSFGVSSGLLSAKKGAGWELSSPFNVKPQLAGSEEGTREVRFVFANLSKGDFRLSGLYVDPRMS